MAQDPSDDFPVPASGNKAEIRNRLYESDLELIRVLEDLIDVLIGKGVIVLTDLPEAAQMKLAERRNLRSHLSDLGSIVTEQDDIALP